MSAEHASSDWLLENCPDAHVALDLQGTVLSWNAAAARLFGRSAAEAVGAPLDSELAPAIETARKNGNAIHTFRDHIVTVRRGDGGLALYARPAGDERPSLERLRAFLEGTPDAMILVGSDGRIILANRRVRELFGWQPDELAGLPIEMLIPERFRGRHAGHRAGFFAEGRSRAMGSGLELYGLRRDGSEFPVEISLRSLDSGEGRFVMSAIRDITDRRKADELKFRLAAIVDSSDDAILSKTLDGVITSWNRGAERLYGYAAREAIGQSISILIPPGGEQHAALMERISRGERIETFETRRRRKDGREIDVAVTISPIFDAQGKIVGASNITRDITDRKRDERALARAKDAAEAAGRELEAFSYSVAHDLRAPLRAIDGFSLALLEDCDARLDEPGRRHLRKVREAAQYMAQLIENLLTLSRVTQSDLRNDRVDLSALARTTAQRLQASQPGRKVDLRIEPGLVTKGDARMLAILLENLLGNSWKFTGKKSDPRIEFGRTEQDGRSVYFVRDNGAGFDMAYSAKLFGVFQRLHAAHEFEGIGIGLATVQRIIRRHGGRVWAEGAVDRGASFYFTFGDERS